MKTIRTSVKTNSYNKNQSTSLLNRITTSKQQRKYCTDYSFRERFDITFGVALGEGVSISILNSALFN